jgi:hypothetical protein
MQAGYRVHAMPRTNDPRLSTHRNAASPRNSSAKAMMITMLPTTAPPCSFTLSLPEIAIGKPKGCASKPLGGAGSPSLVPRGCEARARHSIVNRSEPRRLPWLNTAGLPIDAVDSTVAIVSVVSATALGVIGGGSVGIGGVWWTRTCGVRVNAAVVDDVLTGVCVMITVLDFVWVADGNVVRDAVAAIDVVSAGVTESDGRWE